MTLAAPPVVRSEPPRWRRMVPPAVVGGGLAALTVALHFRDPHADGSWGLCPFALLGFQCPGCGGLRAVNDLTNLRLVDAASSNLLLIVSVPALAYVFWRWAGGRWAGRTWDPSDRWLRNAAVLLATSMVVFTALRNTAAGSWLAP